jgi:hypothetical protein
MKLLIAVLGSSALICKFSVAIFVCSFPQAQRYRK